MCLRMDMGGGGICHTCCDDKHWFFIQRTGPFSRPYDRQEALMTYSNTSPHGIVLALNNIDTIRVIFSWSNLEYIEVKSITQIYLIGISLGQGNYLTEHLKCLLYFRIFIQVSLISTLFTLNHFLEVKSNEWYRMIKTEYKNHVKLFNYLGKKYLFSKGSDIENPWFFFVTISNLRKYKMANDIIKRVCYLKVH